MRLVRSLLLLAATSQPALAYCGREDGPAVGAAGTALKTGDPEVVLVWISAADEQVVSAALTQARAVRRLGKVARELADQYFIETVARLHCLALDEPFLGVAPAGYDFGPALLAAEDAIKTGEVDRLLRALQRDLERAFRAHWNQVQAAKTAYHKGDREAGRRYAMAYLDFVDFVASVYSLLHWGEHPQNHDEAAHLD